MTFLILFSGEGCKHPVSSDHSAIHGLLSSFPLLKADVLVACCIPSRGSFQLIELSNYCLKGRSDSSKTKGHLLELCFLVLVRCRHDLAHSVDHGTFNSVPEYPVEHRNDLLITSGSIVGADELIGARDSHVCLPNVSEAPAVELDKEALKGLFSSETKSCFNIDGSESVVLV